MDACEAGQGGHFHQDDEQIAIVKLAASELQATGRLQHECNPSIIKLQSATAGRCATFTGKRLPGHKVFPDGSAYPGF